MHTRAYARSRSHDWLTRARARTHSQAVLLLQLLAQVKVAPYISAKLDVVSGWMPWLAQMDCALPSVRICSF
jgi:hypothetical protein